MIGAFGVLVCVIVPWIYANMRYFWPKATCCGHTLRPAFKADQVHTAGSTRVPPVV
jgi:hypothetical protein